MSSARAFLGGIIDYAGMFPPARLGMDDAIREYARYREGSDNDLLGRFILPASRLGEFSSAAQSFVARKDPWKISAIVSAGSETDIDMISEFNAEQAGVVVDAIEMPVHSASEIEWAASHFGKSFSLFLEPPLVPDCTDLLEAISKAGVAAKIRTGGVVPGAIPSASAVLRFIENCATLALPFKATAGLHHAIRGRYPLTYDSDAPRGKMFGYLNVFLTAAFLRAGLPASSLLDLLEEEDASSITFSDDGVRWRGNLADTSTLADTRKSLSVSFGSCSFTEPVDEAKQLHLI
ncbi:MAG TPA: hypothetical protein VM053_00415 [Gemmatimonadaceae bacterium]|nr:hypothetical protein [Gemmatimonadaceae bacterium]